MKIYKDRNTDSEIFSDIYKMDLIDGVIYEIEGVNISRTIDASNVDIGANASQEEAAEELEGTLEQGPNFVLNGRLKKSDTPMKKKEYMLYLKSYFKTLPEFDKDKQAKVQAYMGKVFPKFSSFDQFLPEGDYVDIDDKKFPMVLLVNYRDDTDNPYMICFKDGLYEEKV